MSKKLWVALGVVLALTAPAWTAAEAAPASPARAFQLNVDDRCDPETFNQALGDGACAPSAHGDITFDQFLNRLNPQDFGHDAWRFKPTSATMTSADTIHAVSRGGEFHTFTEVPEFGAGCVRELNEPLGLDGHPAVRCTQEMFMATGIGPGGTLDVGPLAPGTHLFECMIHPWMRSTITVQS